MDKPNLIKKAGNFINAATKHVANGFASVPEEIASERMKICRACENYEAPENPKCKVCGCYLNLKVTWASEACPIKKWLAYNKKLTGGFGDIPLPPARTEPNIFAIHQGCGGCGNNSA